MVMKTILTFVRPIMISMIFAWVGGSAFSTQAQANSVMCAISFLDVETPAGEISGHERVRWAEQTLGRSLTTTDEAESLLKAHNIGLLPRETGLNGQPAGPGNWTIGQLKRKVRQLSLGGFTLAEINTLMPHGVAGYGQSPFSILREELNISEYTSQTDIDQRYRAQVAELQSAIRMGLGGAPRDRLANLQWAYANYRANSSVRSTQNSPLAYDQLSAGSAYGPDSARTPEEAAQRWGLRYDPWTHNYRSIDDPAVQYMITQDASGRFVFRRLY
jgi:hypothetical protein